EAGRGGWPAMTRGFRRTADAACADCSTMARYRVWTQFGDGRGQRALVEVGQCPLAEQCPAGRDRTLRLLGAMYQRGDLLGQRALADPGGRPLGAVPHQLVDLLSRLEAEHAQQVRHLGVRPGATALA